MGLLLRTGSERDSSWHGERCMHAQVVGGRVRLRTLLHCMPASAGPVLLNAEQWSILYTALRLRMQIKTRLVHAESLVHEMRYSRTSHAERLTRKKNTDKRFSGLVT